MMVRVPIAPIVAAASLVATLGATPAFAQCPAIQAGCGTILGTQLQLKDPNPGISPYKRQMKLKGVDKTSALTITGDPIANGADVELLAFGAGGLQSQCVHLDAGAYAFGEGWRGTAFGGVAKYSFKTKLGGPVRTLQIASKGSGLPFQLQIKVDAKTAALDLVPPNPGTYAGAIVTIGGGGGQYAVNFGGTAGGLFARNDDKMLKINRPTAAGACPDPSATCGDGTVSAPFETCEVGSADSLCSDADCGSHGLPCLCPFCGDGVAGPNSASLPPATEECDGHDLQACTEGCSRQCTCTICGDGLVQSPGEECDIGASDPNEFCDTGSGSTCLDDGNPNVHDPLECRCSGVCGDDIRNQFSEDCDGGDLGICVNADCIAAGDPGGNGCKCGFCGDGYQNTPSEQCDGADDFDCPGACQPDCTCGPFCGDGIKNGSEGCDPPEDSDCSGSCQADCTCP